MKKVFIICLSIVFAGITACKDDDPELGGAPSEADAGFTFTASAESNNIINFKSNRSDVIAIWDFGNSTSAQGSSATASYPRKGVYTVSLTVFSRGGSVSTTQEVNILEDDFSLLSDPLFALLTGGVDSVNGKTWVIDSANAGHFGVGPNPSSALGDIPEWFSAPPNDKSGVGLYNDRYTFYLDGFQFDMVTQGEIYVHGDHQDKFPGAFQNKGDYTAPYPNQIGKSWTLNFEAGEDTTLNLSSGAFIGFNTQVNSYKIVSLTENEMIIRQLHDGNDGLAWYHRLIPEGYVPDAGGGGGGGGSTGSSLPMDFETEEPEWTPFGNSTVAYIDNPDKRGINTSDRVLETVHGDETWAGFSVDLADDLDFTTDTSIAVKIWAPTVGTMRIKIEDQDDENVFIEKDVSVPVAFTWIEVSVGFSGAATDTYNKLVLFPGWDVANAGTFYIDDVEQK